MSTRTTVRIGRELLGGELVPSYDERAHDLAPKPTRCRPKAVWPSTHEAIATLTIGQFLMLPQSGTWYFFSNQ
jgi:hypothetical protein